MKPETRAKLEKIIAATKPRMGEAAEYCRSLHGLTAADTAKVDAVIKAVRG